MLNIEISKRIFNMRDQRKADEIATKRVQLLLPLLDQGLDTTRAKQIKPVSAHRTASPNAPCAVIWYSIKQRDLMVLNTCTFFILKFEANNPKHRSTSLQMQFLASSRFPGRFFPCCPIAQECHLLFLKQNSNRQRPRSRLFSLKSQ